MSKHLHRLLLEPSHLRFSDGRPETGAGPRTRTEAENERRRGGRTKVGRLWMKSGVPKEKIYSIIPALEFKGLVEVIPKFPKEVKAVPFLRFANDFLTERKCLLDEICEKRAAQGGDEKDGEVCAGPWLT